MTAPEPTVVDVGSNSGNYALTSKQLPSNNLERDFSSYLQTKDADDKQQNQTATQLSLTPSKRELCYLFLKHIDSCPGCRKKMEEKFGNVVEKYINPTPAPVPAAPNYFEIVMIILVGIILIIVMDSFVRIGKILHK
jgi:hypothetical protein